MAQKRSGIAGQSEPTPKTGKGENPNRSLALKRIIFCALPLAPVPISVTLIVLNFRGTFLLDLKVLGQSLANEVTNIFQFASWAYANLIVASVTAIMFHRIQHDLLERDGIPLGTLVTSYQLSDPMSLLHKQFLVGTLMNKQIVRHYTLLILLVWAIAVANGASPFGAIAIIPKAGQWPLSKAWAESQGGLNETGFYVANETALWPLHLNATFLDPSCLTSNAIQNESCPAGGYSSIKDTLPHWTILGWNITFFNDNVSRTISSFSTFNSTSLSYGVGQVLCRSLKNYFPLMFLDWQLTLSAEKGHDLLAPVVAVKCNASPANNSVLEFPHDFFSLPDSTGWTVDRSSVFNETADLTSKTVEFTWVDLSRFGSASSIGASFRLREADLSSNTFTLDTTNISYSLNDTIIACTVSATWTPAAPSLWPVTGSTVSLGYFTGPSSGSSDAGNIQIDLEWAAALNLPLSDSNLTTMESLVDVLARTAATEAANGNVENLANFGGSVADTIGLMVTDGLCRIGWNSPFVRGNQGSQDGQQTLITMSNNGTELDNNTNPQGQNWVQLTVDISTYGLGYSTDLVTVKIAIAFLLLHAVVAISYAVLVCTAGKTWASSSLESVWELLGLALESGSIKLTVASASASKPNKRCLSRVRAFVESGKTWQQPIGVKEGRLERLPRPRDAQVNDRPEEVEVKEKSIGIVTA